MSKHTALALVCAVSTAICMIQQQFQQYWQQWRFGKKIRVSP